jgi:DNA-binding LytR/AlgR family response regulator
MIKCVIIDKDKDSLAATEKCVKLFGHLILVDTFTTVAEAAPTIKENKIDLIFLTLPPEVGSSLEFLKFMKYERPEMVFISGEKKFAKEAFDHDAIDFILKPITVERLAKAIAKAFGSQGGTSMEELIGKENILFVKDKRHFVRVNLTDIYLVEALSDYVNIYAKDKRYTVHATMKSMVDKLPADQYVRFHNSYIGRIDRIQEITKDALTLEGKEYPVSHTYKKSLLEKLKLA